MKKLLISLLLLLALLCTSALADEVSISDLEMHLHSRHGFRIDLSALERYRCEWDDMTYSGLFYTDDTRFAYGMYEQAESLFPVYAQLGFEAEARDGKLYIYPVLLLPINEEIICNFKSGGFRCRINNRQDVERNGKLYRGVFCDNEYSYLDCEAGDLIVLRMTHDMLDLLEAIAENGECTSYYEVEYSLPEQSIAVIQAYVADTDSIKFPDCSSEAFWFTLYTDW